MMNLMDFVRLATHVGLHHFLLFSAILFAIGLFGLLTKKGLIPLLMCVELMLNAVNINLVAFNHYMPVSHEDADRAVEEIERRLQKAYEQLG